MLWKCVKFCPGLQNDTAGMSELYLFVQSSDNRTPLEEASGMTPVGAKEYVRTLQQVAGLTPEQFYDRFKSGDHLGCFDAPRSLWP